MRYEITKEFALEAAHRLDKLPTDHKCFREHGHSYRVIITVSASKLDDMGFVVDFGVLTDFVKKLFDHQNLNTIFAPTTVENFCATMWDAIEKYVLLPLKDPDVRIDSLTIYETPSGSCTLRRGS